jgi:hypothetical protein
MVDVVGQRFIAFKATMFFKEVINFELYIVHPFAVGCICSFQIFKSIFDI